MNTASKVIIKKQRSNEDLENCSKDELISRIKSLTAHNIQLKSLISKLSDKHPNDIPELKPFDFDKSNFRHIALKILYLGWNYKGYVVQEDTSETIEHHLFRALKKAKLIKDRDSSNYHRCGRTDKGVSSFGQVISIDVRTKQCLKKKDDIEEELKYCKILNALLPEDIRCIAWSPVEKDFSARFDCKMRKYKYYFPKGLLNIDKMKLASEKLIGCHDFRNFCKMDVGNGVVEFIRNVKNITIEPIQVQDDAESTIFVVTIEANAFLWHQIRCIIGVLFLIGQNKETPEVIDEMLDVNANPRKPEYSMASEIPLNLFYCEYENIHWYYDREALSLLIQKMSGIWALETIKSHMIADMLSSLKDEYHKINDSKANDFECFSESLLLGKQPKKYIPLMERQRCMSLEDKIQHFAKRKRIEVIPECDK